MAELKTARSKASVKAFVDGIEDPRRRRDCRAVMKRTARLTGKRPAMWGKSIVGYGAYTYTNTTGKPQQWMLTGVSPRKNALTVYVMNGFSRYGPLLEKLGRHRTGKSCLYLNDLDQVDLPTLEQLLERSIADLRNAYETD